MKRIAAIVVLTFLSSVQETGRYHLPSAEEIAEHERRVMKREFEKQKGGPVTEKSLQEIIDSRGLPAFSVGSVEIGAKGLIAVNPRFDGLKPNPSVFYNRVLVYGEQGAWRGGSCLASDMSCSHLDATFYYHPVFLGVNPGNLIPAPCYLVHVDDKGSITRAEKVENASFLFSPPITFWPSNYNRHFKSGPLIYQVVPVQK